MLEVADLLDVGDSSGASARMENVTDSYGDPRACYLHGDVAVCVRIALLLLFVIVSGLLLFFRVLQYHLYKNTNYSQYVVFYTGLLIVVILILHAVYFYKAYLDFVAIYLVIFQLNVILLAYSSWASRLLHMEKIMYVIIPLALCMLIGFLVICAWALWSSIKYGDIKECTRPQWLIFSIFQFILVQLYTIIVWYIIRKTSGVRTALSNKLSQKAQLIFIVVVYQVVSIFALVYDIYLIAAGHSSCTTITPSEVGDVVLEVVKQAVKFLLPQVAVVVIFAPRKPPKSDPTPKSSPGLTRAVNYGSFESDRDALLPVPINQPPGHVPFSTEDYRNYPSLPISNPYTPSSSGYNYYNNPYKKAFSGSHS